MGRAPGARRGARRGRVRPGGRRAPARVAPRAPRPRQPPPPRRTDEAEAEDDAFALDAGDVAYDGVVFRVDEGAFETEGYDEGDEFEADAEGDLALVAELDGAIVNVRRAAPRRGEG